MDMLSILVDVITWRIFLCFIGGIALALSLLHCFAWFAVGYGILIVIFSLFFGVFWQARVDGAMYEAINRKESE